MAGLVYALYVLSASEAQILTMKNILITIIVANCLSCAPAKPVQVQFKNESKEAFSSLDLNLFGKTYHFTNLQSGGSTAYIAIDSIYRYHYAKAVTLIDTVVCQPIDFVGETAIKSGKHTLGLRIDTINGERTLVFTDPSLMTVSKKLYEGYTSPADVVDNLFVSVNNKDWNTSRTYYDANASIRDNRQAVLNADPIYFFKNLFEKEEVYKILISSAKSQDDYVHVQARMRKGSRSAEYPLCLVFKITNGKIVEQDTEPCLRDFPIPTATKYSSEHDAALLQGSLIEKDGCLSVKDLVLLWPYGYTAGWMGQQVVVKDEHGTVIARSGEIIKVSGGEVKNVRLLQPGEIDFKRSPCKGTGWVVGSVTK